MKFTDGNGFFIFKTNEEPRAIWRLGGEYYAACSGPAGGWLIIKIASNGSTKEITMKELPEGERKWNMCDKDSQEYWEDEFQRWAQ